MIFDIILWPQINIDLKWFKRHPKFPGQENNSEGTTPVE